MAPLQIRKTFSGFASGSANRLKETMQTTPSAPQTPRIQVNQEEANLVTFTPIVEQQVPQEQGAAGMQEQPK